MDRLARRDPEAWLRQRARDREAFIRSWRESLAKLDDVRETYEQFAARVALEAPRDLEALGVPVPFLAWKRAVEYTRDLRVARLELFLKKLYGLTYNVALSIRYDLNPGVPARDLIADLKAEIALGLQSFAARYLPLALQRLRRAEIDAIVGRDSVIAAALPQ